MAPSNTTPPVLDYASSFAKPHRGFLRAVLTVVSVGFAGFLLLALFTRTDIDGPDMACRARLSAVASTITALRTVLDSYRSEHAGQYPTLSQMSSWSVLLEKTDESGQITAAGRFGPYLWDSPCNPFTLSPQVVSTQSAVASAGWTYDETTGQIVAIVPLKDASDVKRIAKQDGILMSDFLFVP